ncbi:MAG: hypothetical protein AABY07_10325 [Nanoarchaeota archaeon]
MRIFETKDKSRRLIYLSNERWKHILEHKEMHNQVTIEQIKDILLHPNKIVPDKYDHHARIYHRYYKDRKEYLAVLVKYLMGKDSL